MNSQDNKGNKPLPEEIQWRIKFLAAVAGGLHSSETVLGEDECCGLMSLLNDIADMIGSVEAG
jgi:hypothetical protein